MWKAQRARQRPTRPCAGRPQTVESLGAIERINDRASQKLQACATHPAYEFWADTKQSARFSPSTQGNRDGVGAYSPFALQLPSSVNLSAGMLSNTTASSTHTITAPLSPARKKYSMSLPPEWRMLSSNLRPNPAADAIDDASWCSGGGRFSSSPLGRRLRSLSTAMPVSACNHWTYPSTTSAL